MTYFAFCIHNHQPVGNFDRVIEEAYEESYWPFLKTLSDYPSIKLTLHTSGFLLDWIVENRPRYISLLKEMVRRGQVEILGGGYYEPVLPVIPERDRIGQIRMMSDKVHELFGVRPRGIWLAERVWEPALPVSLKKAGVEYLLVDDFHFIKSGLKREELGGYYLTEDEGNVIKVFPGSEALRYMIPFKPVAELQEYLKGLGGFFKRGNAAIYGDDGEKFGVWPGTHKWVYGEGWLKGFFEEIEGLGWLCPVTLAEYLDREPPLGRVYLPATSYMEMGEWSLPAEASREYTALVEEMKKHPDGARIRKYLCGGIWRNFMAKYPEANWLHKRMLLASSALEEARALNPGGRSLDKAERLLYMGQCNDSYWHGIFGGLYLPHLRTAVYENLIGAENAVEEALGASMREKPSVVKMDFDSDGNEEVIVRSADLNLFLSPSSGGALYELDYKKRAVNLLNTLTRWSEGYHHRLYSAGKETGVTGVKTIHDLMVAKEKDLDKYLRADTVRRGSFIDHFLPKASTLESFKDNAHREESSFHTGRYEAEISPETGSVTLARWDDVEGVGVLVMKEIEPVAKDSFTVDYRIENNTVGEEGSNVHLFAVELNLMLPCCDGPACLYEFNLPLNVNVTDIGLASTGEIGAIEKLQVVDRFRGVMMGIDISMPVRLWRFPVYTVSLSEAGFERIYQGSCLVFLTQVDLSSISPVEFSFSFKLSPYGG